MSINSGSTFGDFGAKPHILFTLVDDWGWELWPRRSDLGDVHAQLLPEIRRTFVDEGITLARHYTYSYCAPSRQSLLSGRQPLHVNEENSVCQGIARGMWTMADMLKSAGYATHFVGKWHAGFGDASATPSRRGFDTSLGFYMKAHHHFSHCSYLGFEFAAKEHNECRSAPSNRSVPLTDFFVGDAASGDVPLGRRHPAVANRTYSTHLFVGEALRRVWAHDAAGAPLFLFLSLSAVHKPFLAPPDMMQRAALAHPARYYRECPWVRGSPTKCRAKHRKGYEAMALGVDDGVRQLRDALVAKQMWARTLLIFASDNGGPIGPQASNLPLRGGKDNNLEGGVRTLAALGGGWLPPHAHGLTSAAFMHEADWLSTLAHAAGVAATDGRAAAVGLPAVDGLSLWSSWTALVDGARDGARDGAHGARATSPPHGVSAVGAGAPMLGAPRTIILATRHGLPGTPFGGTSALIEVLPALGEEPPTAYKLLRGVVCECPECRPCQLCNATGGGCVFDIVNDPTERRDLAAERPELLARLAKKLDEALRTKFVDRDPVNQECWLHPKSEPDHWMEVALARGQCMQPWLRTPSKRGAKPRVLFPHLLRVKRL